ncbi:MAG: hypothetical protein AB1744_09210, partial [Candidatus Zixiibacteriota bacterium]
VMKSMKLITTCLALVLGLSATTDAVIRKVGRVYNVIDVYGGYSTPIGEYDELGSAIFTDRNLRVVELKADSVYNATFHVGFTYGQLRGGHFMYSIGFRYTKIETLDTFVTDRVGDTIFFVFFEPRTPSFNQYDVDFNVNVYATNPSKAIISPYVGLGVSAGITSQTDEGFDSQNWLTVNFRVNFGGELKLWEAPKIRSFVTLASINSVDLLASDKHPRYLNIGGAVKYYFRM